MISIIDKDDANNVIPMMLADDAWYVVHVYNGSDTLQFTINERSEYYGLFEEESKILATGLRGGDNRFVVKNIDSHSGSVVVDCSLDLYDWQQTIYDTYRKLNYTLDEVLQDITPSGWTYSGQQQFGETATVESARSEPFKAATPLDILSGCQEIFGCVFNFDVINCHLTVIDPESYEASGDFVSTEVNLKSVGFVGNSDGYATRLYAYGKRDDNGENPVTFEDINDGKPYVDNNKFSDDIICVGWSDERYTIPENLLDAAKVKLAELATPVRSYTCEVSQLNRNIWMYMVLTMIDPVHGTRVNHQIVEWQEYARPDLDVVTLSAVTPSIEEILNNNFNKDDGLTDDDVWNIVNGVSDDITNAYTEAIENATNKITGNNGGYFQQIFDAEGNWIELINLGDSMDPNQARKVWRWNASGLGHSNNGINGSFDLALLADGSINATMITTGILQGGQSYWNMNTGDMSLVGAIRTQADTSDLGIIIDPDVTLYYPDSGQESNAAIIKFSGKYSNMPWIAADYASNNSSTNLTLFSGRSTSSYVPGLAYVSTRSGPYSGSSHSVSYNGATSSFLKAYSGSNSNSNSYAFISANVYRVNSYTTDICIDAFAKQTSDNFYVGIQSSTYTGALYLGGYLEGFSGSATLYAFTVTFDDIQPNRYGYLDFTLDTPAIKGSYMTLVTPRYAQYALGYVLCGTTAGTVGLVEGATAFMRTPPYQTMGRASQNGTNTFYNSAAWSNMTLILNCLMCLKKVS